MALPSDYVTGTITLTNGSAAFTGTGTGWLAADFREGDIILDIAGAEGRVLVIEEVTANGAGTLTRPWTGSTLTGVAYRMRYQWDSGRVSAQSRAMIEQLGNGNLQSIAALTGPGVLVFDGPHSAAIKPESEFINGVAYNVQVDELSDRDAFDGQSAGFAVLVSDVGDGRAAIYSKASNTIGDWTDPGYVTGPVGPASTVPGIVWRGAYNGATAYSANDGVLDNESSWRAKIATTGNAPPNLPTTSNTQWELIAAKGTDGTGTGDVVGPSGGTADNGFVLFANTTGKLIKTVTASAYTALLSVFTSSTKGLVPSPITSTGRFLRDDATWAALPDLSVTTSILALQTADNLNLPISGPNWLADAFDTLTYVDVVGATNLDTSTAGVLKPTTNPGGTYGPGGGSGGAGYNNSGSLAGVGKTPNGFGGGAGGASVAASGSSPGTGAAGALGLIVIQYTPSGGSLKTIALTSGTSWVVPSDWNSASNSIETIGAGGGSANATGNGSSGNTSGGGGGGGYSKITNLSLTPSASITIAIGSSAAATAGGDTWFNGASLSASSVGAKGGAPSVGATGGAGGASASGIGATKNSGGSGGSGAAIGGGPAGGGGGGGAAGPNGAGGGGSNSTGTNAGGGGGGANSGSTATTGAGGNGRGGTGSGAAGNPGNPGTSGTGAGGGGSTLGSGTSVANVTGGAGAQDDVWVVPATANNLTVRSSALTAASDPATVEALLQLKEVDAATPGTDYTVEFTRDNGTTWTAATLTELFTSQTPVANIIFVRALATVSAQPSGTNIRWRIKTLTGKNIEFHAAKTEWSA